MKVRDTPKTKSGFAQEARAITICRATEKDLPVICLLGMEVSAIHHEAWPDIFTPAAHPDRDLPFWRARFSAKGSGVFLAKEAGRPVGMVMAHVVDEETVSLLQPNRFCRIGTIVVTTSHQGRGIGRKLMSALEAWAALELVTSIRLTVWEFNRSAVAFYEELGYSTRSLSIAKAVKKVELDIEIARCKSVMEPDKA